MKGSIEKFGGISINKTKQSDKRFTKGFKT